MTLYATSSLSLPPKGCISKEQMRSPTLVSRSCSLGPRVSQALLGWEVLWEGLLTQGCLFPAGSLSAFVCQHSIMALALPCKLSIPKKGGSGPQGGNKHPDTGSIFSH